MKNIFRDRSGTSTVEFALLAPVFFLIVFFLLDMGRAYWTLSTMEYAVEAGGRYVMLNSTATSSQVIAQAKANLYAIDPNSINITTSNTTSNGINYMVISAQTNFNFLPGALFPVSTLTMSRQVQAPLF